MILKQQQCVPSLPCTVLLRVKFGEIAHFCLAQAMWGYDALPQPALLLQVQGRYASLQEAGLAWEVHYQEMHAHSTPELQPSIDGIIQTFAFGFMEYLQLANQSIIDDSHPQAASCTILANHATDMWQLLQCYCKVYGDRLRQIIHLWQSSVQSGKDAVKVESLVAKDAEQTTHVPCQRSSPNKSLSARELLRNTLAWALDNTNMSSGDTIDTSSFRSTRPLDTTSNRCRAFLVGQSVRRLISRFGSVITDDEMALKRIRRPLERPTPFVNFGDLRSPLEKQLVLKMYSRVYVIAGLNEYFVNCKARDHFRRVNAQKLHYSEWWSLLQNLIDKSLRILSLSMKRLHRAFFEMWQTNAAFQRSNTLEMMAHHKTFSKLRDVFRSPDDISALNKLRIQLAASWKGLLENRDDKQLEILAWDEVAYTKQLLGSSTASTFCIECARYQKIGHCPCSNEIMSRYLIAQHIIASIGKYKFIKHFVKPGPFNTSARWKAYINIHLKIKAIDLNLNLSKHLREYPELHNVCISTIERTPDPRPPKTQRQLLTEHLYRCLPQYFGQSAPRYAERTLCKIILIHLRDLYYEIATDLLQKVCYEISTDPYKGNATVAQCIKLAYECLQEVRAYETNDWDDPTVVNTIKQRDAVSDILLCYFIQPDGRYLKHLASEIREFEMYLKYIQPRLAIVAALIYDPDRHQNLHDSGRQYDERTQHDTMRRSKLGCPGSGSEFMQRVNADNMDPTEYGPDKNVASRSTSSCFSSATNNKPKPKRKQKLAASKVPPEAPNRYNNTRHAKPMAFGDVACAIRDTKERWESVLSAMKNLATPKIVIELATAAMKVTATIWFFNPTNAAAAVINKCEERLPQIFGNPDGNCELANLGKILCVVYPDTAANAIWKHVKTQQIARMGTSTLVLNSLDNMDKANSAWATHYEKRIRQGCQRRDLHIYRTVYSTRQEMRELFTELYDASRLCIDHNETRNLAFLGSSGISARIADEAGDAWYGAQCYAVAYKEQVQWVLREWSSNKKAEVDNQQGSSQFPASTPSNNDKSKGTQAGEIVLRALDRIIINNLDQFHVAQWLERGLVYWDTMRHTK